MRVDKQTNRSQFSWACPVINNEFRPNIVNVSCEPTIISRDNFQTKFMMSNRTDEWHTFVSAHTFCASLKAKFDINAINYATKYTTKAREYSTLADFCRKTADFLSGWNRFKILGPSSCRTPGDYLLKKTALRFEAESSKIKMTPIPLKWLMTLPNWSRCARAPTNC